MSDDLKAAAVELSHAETLRLDRHLPWVDFRDEGDVLRVFSGDTWPGNFVARAQFTPATAHRRIGEILAPHLAKKVSCNWVVGPVSQPADLGKHLRAHGFRCMIHCAGMACDLGRLTAKPPPPHGVTIALVDELPPLRPLTTERRKRRHQGRILLGRLTPRQVWNFSARSAGQAVGETTLIVGAGVAGIYGVEVQEKFRRRGIGSALVYAAIAQARELGFPLAVLSATGMGNGVYAGVGFREVCKFSFWKYGKMRQLRAA